MCKLKEVWIHILVRRRSSIRRREAKGTSIGEEMWRVCDFHLQVYEWKVKLYPRQRYFVLSIWTNYRRWKCILPSNWDCETVGRNRRVQEFIFEYLWLSLWFYDDNPSEGSNVLFYSFHITPSLSLLLNSMPSFKACRVALLQKIIKFAHESSFYYLDLLSVESLEFFYNYLMEQENGNWKDVMGDYRQVLISLKDTLLEMKKKLGFVMFFMIRKEAYQCLLKLVSTYDTNEPDYVTYANECSMSQYHCRT